MIPLFKLASNFAQWQLTLLQQKHSSKNDTKNIFPTDHHYKNKHWTANLVTSGSFYYEFLIHADGIVKLSASWEKAI